jgi:hypothetical protein
MIKKQVGLPRSAIAGYHVDYFAEVGNGERVTIRGRPLVAGERVGCF